LSLIALVQPVAFAEWGTHRRQTSRRESFGITKQ
jgi:hypothetical protein